MVQSYDNNQGKQSGKPVFPGTVIRVGGSSCHVIDRSGVQGKSDGEDDRAGYQRREQYTDLSDEDTDEQRDTATDNLGAEDRRDVKTFSDRLHAWHVSKADTHNDRQ